MKANALRDHLLDANTNEVPTIVEEMDSYRRWIDPLLHDAYAQAKDDKDARKQLHASLALLPVDATQVDYLYGRLLDAEPHEVPVIRDALAPHKDALLDKLWAVVEKPEKGKESQRLRAAAALAKYDPESESGRSAGRAGRQRSGAWKTRCFWASGGRRSWPDQGVVAGPVGRHLSRPATRAGAERIPGDEPSGRLRRRPAAGLGRSAHGRRREAVRRDLSEVQGTGRAGPARVDRRDRQEAAARPAILGRRAEEKLAKRQANAAVALLRMNQPAKVWPLLKHSPDPRVRSYLIHRLGPLGADAGPSSSVWTRVKSRT